MKKISYLSVVVLFISGLRGIAAPLASQGLQASNLLNPNISAIGWFQAEAGHRQGEEGEAFQIKEVELGIQAVVDPYSRADIFIAFEDGEAEIEEATLTWTHLPYNLGLKLGKFLTNFGKFNRIHSPETAFATRPFAFETYFGEEGFSGMGASFSWLVPNPLFYTNLDVEAINTPEGEEVPGFEKAEKKDLTYVTRLGSFFDLNEASNMAFGFNFAHGSAGEEFVTVKNSSETLRSLFYGVDLTFRWKNPRQALYRSLLWQTELFWNERELSTIDTEYSMGLYSHLGYQFARRWTTGVRLDYSETPTDKRIQEQGGLVYLTFNPSEYTSISLQGQHKNMDDNREENLGFFRVIFNVGPHGTHPY